MIFPFLWSNIQSFHPHLSQVLTLVVLKIFHFMISLMTKLQQAYGLPEKVWFQQVKQELLLSLTWCIHLHEGIARE